jgi:hypothetical protein
VRDRELITGPETTNLDPLTVDTNPVGTTQVAHNNLAAILRHTTMMTRDAKRIESRVALGMAADNHHGAIQGDIRAFIQSHETSGHGGVSQIRPITQPGVHLSSEPPIKNL